MVSFSLYDGYEFVESVRNDAKREPSNSLSQCLNWCVQNKMCHGINYNGHTCQLIEHITSGQLVLYDANKLSFGIFAQKICITGMFDNTFVVNSKLINDKFMHLQTNTPNVPVDNGHSSTFLAIISLI